MTWLPCTAGAAAAAGSARLCRTRGCRAPQAAASINQQPWQQTLLLRRPQWRCPRSRTARQRHISSLERRITRRLLCSRPLWRRLGQPCRLPFRNPLQWESTAPLPPPPSPPPQEQEQQQLQQKRQPVPWTDGQEWRPQPQAPASVQEHLPSTPQQWQQPHVTPLQQPAAQGSEYTTPQPQVLPYHAAGFQQPWQRPLQQDVHSDPLPPPPRQQQRQQHVPWQQHLHHEQPQQQPWVHQQQYPTLQAAQTPQQPAAALQPHAQHNPLQQQPRQYWPPLQQHAHSPTRQAVVGEHSRQPPGAAAALAARVAAAPRAAARHLAAATGAAAAAAGLGSSSASAAAHCAHP